LTECRQEVQYAGFHRRKGVIKTTPQGRKANGFGGLRSAQQTGRARGEVQKEKSNKCRNLKFRGVTEVPGTPYDFTDRMKGTFGGPEKNGFDVAELQPCGGR